MTGFTPSTRNEPPSLVDVTTLVVWVLCLTVGWLGLCLSYRRPQSPVRVPPSLEVELLQVELASSPVLLQAPASGRTPTPSPPRIPHPTTTLAAPPVLAMDTPASKVAFALPVSEPIRVADGPTVAASTAPASASASDRAEPRTPVQSLIHGEGEGKQPAPEYPRRAVLQGQEGVVTVRFTVRPDGRVASAEVFIPSAWPLLNDAALRVIRDRWRFLPGAARLFEVPIRFELKKRSGSPPRAAFRQTSERETQP